MKKVGKILKSNLKLIVGIIVGLLLSGGVVYAANIAATSVDYDDTKTSLGATKVQGALESLYEKAASTSTSTGIDPSYIDFGTLATNTKKTVLASSAGVCIKRKGEVSCFKRNNWNVEKDHIQQVFSDISCNVRSSYVDCDASAFRCNVDSNGYVRCSDQSDNSYCTVNSDGSVYCY